MLGWRILTPAARFGSTPLPKMSVMFSNIDSHDLPAITSLLNAISDPAVLLNLDYEICAANDAYRRTFANDEEILQRHCYEVADGYRVPCDRAGEPCPLRQCLETGQRQRIRHTHKPERAREH